VTGADKVVLIRFKVLCCAEVELGASKDDNVADGKHIVI
jgi:hypothetical protein